MRDIVVCRLISAKSELDAVRPIMALLQQRYDIEDGDGMYSAVRRALESDNDYWQTAVDKAGMTAEPKLVHEQFGQRRNIPQGRGKTIEFRKFSQLPKALTPLTEGVIRTAARSRSSATPRRSASTAITSRFPIFSKRLRSTPFCRKP